MRIFVCYPSEHEEDARKIRNFIRSVGLNSWFDKDNLVGGDDWNRERQIALSKADLVVVVCAAATTGRNGVYQREINEALEHAKDRRVGTRYIIPVRLADVELPPELGRLQYVDFHQSGGKRSLAASFKRAVEEAGGTVPAPLEVAAAEPDEGGFSNRSITEERENGNLSAEWISYEIEGEYWDYVNGVIRSRVLGDLYQARRHIDEWQKREDFPGGSSWEISLSEHYRRDQFVSLVVGWFEYYAGAAHPNHGIYTINIFGDQAGIIPIDELFEWRQEPLEFLVEYVNQDIKRQAENKNEAWDVGDFVKNDGWDVFKQFSFNEHGMLLNLSSASGLPHVMGYTEVYLPWQHLKRHLSPVAKGLLL
ncbi:hypothetical protein CHH26_07245 [Qipengyuania flava]|uniref:toll/interleukin-1 receptor domain-containing protein n=1 Tax=Qipengyuania flava TaxID=192812 RepID=UPI000B8BE009|nr:toll/interleukin-1 receptor domain-containing protein [Qipengyuania flava]ASP30048.1 hypothetical protein CHH26_07245 [Qipengyuania flava]